MFRIVVRPLAAEQIRSLRRVDAVAVVDAIELYLRYEPNQAPARTDRRNVPTARRGLSRVLRRRRGGGGRELPCCTKGTQRPYTRMKANEDDDRI